MKFEEKNQRWSPLLESLLGRVAIIKMSNSLTQAIACYPIKFQLRFLNHYIVIDS